MKKTILLILIFIFVLANLFAFSACAKKIEKKETAGILQAQGNKIVNASKEKISLRGVNAGGFLIAESWMCPTNAETQSEAIEVLEERFGKDRADTLFKAYLDSWWQEKDFENIKNMGMNCIRLPFWWENFTDKYGNFKINAYERLDWFISLAEKYGLYVILDLHGAYGSQNGRHHSGSTASGLFGNDTNENLTVKLWENIALKYKNNSTVAGYDLLNEPENHPDEIMSKDTPQWNFYDRLYRAIRKIDDRHIIIMEGVWEINSLPAPSLYGWENVMYEYHFYNWAGANDLNREKTFMLKKTVNWDSAEYDVPMLVGEFTHFELIEAWENALSVYNEKGWNWTVWTYKVTGDSSWGIFKSPALVGDEKADIFYDSYETILAKWSALSTDNFTKNVWLADILKKYAEDK